MFKVTQFEPKVLSWWRTQRHKIDMDPPYQRQGRLWSKSDKAFLIDSVLNDYDIPKIYLADFTWGAASKLNRKKMTYAIIDGKQRLEAILDFFDGIVQLNDDFVYDDDRRFQLAGLSYPDLRKNYPDVADKFDNFHLSVMRVVADTEERINEMFVRLNRSKPLSGAEIRNAMTGPVPSIIRKLVEHDLFKTCVRFPRKRGQDKNAAAKILMFEFYEKPSETKKRHLDMFVEEARRERKSRTEVAGRRVLDTLDVMTGVFLPRDPLLSSAGILPVYYWFVRSHLKSAEHIREFLTIFERERRQGGGILRRKETEGVFREFSVYNRSTNDLRSHEGRFGILEVLFRLFLRRSRA